MRPMECVWYVECKFVDVSVRFSLERYRDAECEIQCGACLTWPPAHRVGDCIQMMICSVYPHVETDYWVMHIVPRLCLSGVRWRADYPNMNHGTCVLSSLALCVFPGAPSFRFRHFLLRNSSSGMVSWVVRSHVRARVLLWYAGMCNIFATHLAEISISQYRRAPFDSIQKLL